MPWRDPLTRFGSEISQDRIACAVAFPVVESRERGSICSQCSPLASARILKPVALASIASATIAPFACLERAAWTDM